MIKAIGDAVPGDCGISIPDLDEIIERAWEKIRCGVASTGCGSTEYAFHSKDERHKAVRFLTAELENLINGLRRGHYDLEFGTEDDE